jgi:hypothetical protein
MYKQYWYEIDIWQPDIYRPRWLLNKSIC